MQWWGCHAAAGLRRAQSQGPRLSPKIEPDPLRYLCSAREAGKAEHSRQHGHVYFASGATNNVAVNYGRPSNFPMTFMLFLCRMSLFLPRLS